MKNETVRRVDITPAETETLGELMDIIHEHINDYELTVPELKTLNDAEEILFRLYTFGREFSE